MHVIERSYRTLLFACVLGSMAFLTTVLRSDEGGPEGSPPDQESASEGDSGGSDVELIDVGGDIRNLGVKRAPATPIVQPGTRSILVHLRPGAGHTMLRNFVKGCKARICHEYGTVLPNVVNIRDITDQEVSMLRQLPGVTGIEQDGEVHAYLTRSTTLIRALQSQIAGAGLSADGTGVRVCIIDTGIDSDHFMFSGRIDVAAGRDFANNDNNPEDDNGHGSNVAGIAVGGTGISLTRCGVSEPFQGVAPNATLVGIKVLDQNGSGTFSNVIAGINYAADQTAAGGRCDVINMSLGAGQFTSACDGDSAAAASNNAVNAGVVVVAAAGNDGASNAMGTPACGSQVIAVGAVYDDAFPNCEFPNQNGFTWCLNSFCTNTCTDNNISADSLICFSDQSDMLDVTAPGCEITSADIAVGGMSVSALCGTSQATPHVAGLAALILSADSALTPIEVRQIIRDGAIDLGAPGFDRGYGFGRIDAINSLQLVGPGCVTNADCDDGVFCNGAETCVSGSCQAGTPVNCNDGVACTSDSCNEATASCDNVPSDAACDDGLACNGLETCDAALGCQVGTPVNCNDGVACTTDACTEPSGICTNAPNDAACDDGLFCNGAETCDALLGCQAGAPVNCNDGVACTTDSCNEATNSCDNVANNAACDDGLFCNGNETCDPALDCQAGSNPCPGQVCDEANNTCIQCQVDADCDDGLFCNGNETCVAGSCQAGVSVNCNDAVACTVDSCNEATNSCDNIPSDANCDDGLACNGLETCDAVLGCQAGTAVNCDDGIACTTDACNEPGGTCSNAPNNAACDDGLFCNGAETCDAVLGCLSGTAPTCDDGIACTDDSCNAVTDSCQNVANNANCPDDGLFCNGTESCDAINDCVSSGNPCVSGTVCNEATNTCDMQRTGEGFILSRHADFSTDDRTFNLTETIYMLVWTDRVDFNNINRSRWELKDPNKNKVRQPLTNNFDITYTASFALSGLPSTATSWTWKGDIKDNARVSFKPTTTITVTAAPQCTVDADCADGLFCNGAEVCVGGSCQAGTPVNCNDGVACTIDSCNEATASCDNLPDNAGCDDGLFCNGSESCDALLDCQAGVPIDCNDGVPCTVDSCNEATHSCDNLPDNASCDNGVFCDGAEVCDAILGCQAGSVPTCDDGVVCTIDSCNPATDSCDHIPDSAVCDDGLFCTGVETCDPSLDCQAGADPCPGQICDEASASCVGCVTNADCDDGLFCNGAEVCDAAGVCQAGTPIDCNDGVACTVDSCNEATNSCDNVPDSAGCDDGVFCNGTETCDTVLGCVAGVAPSCNDGIACTDDSCNAVTDSCDNIANDANCPSDGLFCNGVESCDPVLDCVSSGDPCTAGTVCNEATNTCDTQMTGEGFILSLNADFSTDDRVFSRTDTLYMLVWTDRVDFTNLKKAEWELRDANKNKIKQPMTNNFDTTYTASFNLSSLPSNATTWTWKGKIEDKTKTKFNPTTTITVLP